MMADVVCGVLPCPRAAVGGWREHKVMGCSGKRVCYLYGFFMVLLFMTTQVVSDNSSVGSCPVRVGSPKVPFKFYVESTIVPKNT